MAKTDSKEQKRGRKVISKLRNKYRLVLINDRTFEERLSFRLSRLNVIVTATLGLGMIALFVASIIVFTPLRRLIPGYPDQDIRRNAMASASMADSLSHELAIRDAYLNDLRRILKGDISIDSTSTSTVPTVRPSAADLAPSVADSMLRRQIEEQEAFSLSTEANARRATGLSGLTFFTPLRGLVTSTFDRSQGHFGVDVVSKADEAVKATLEGTVIMASWTYDTGYVIQLQHANDLLSVYKHNAVLLKSIGDHVKAGEAIAIVGDSGELSSGPHLHFELWLRGDPVDPQGYMVFQ